MDELAELLTESEGCSELPCRRDPERWFSLEPHDVVLAVEACQACPLMAPCDAFARAQRPHGGVWGGVVWNENRRPGLNSVRARKIAKYAQSRRDAA